MRVALSNAATRVQHSLRYRGIVGSFKFALGGLFGAAGMSEFDMRFGADTEGSVELKRLTVVGSNGEDGVDYAPTHAPSFVAALCNLHIRHSDFTFVDFGSGKGRALLLASWFPFREVVGVEFSKELNAIAQRNISAFRSRRQKCFKLSAVCMDAAEYPIPSGPLVVYAFNPFGEAVMSRVATNLLDSYRAQRREIYFVYFNPQHDRVLRDRGFRLLSDVASHRIFMLA